MAPLTSKQLDSLRELADQDVFTWIMEAVAEKITAEWKAGEDAEAREAAHSKFMALRDVRREIRSLIGKTDG